MSAEPFPATESVARKIILVGNPNVGKSVIFGALTGRYVTVSNYPGTTVEMTSGSARINGIDCEIIDTPGTNTLIPQSEDERVTRDVLLRTADGVAVQVGDLKNLRRTLLLTLQLAEYEIPFVLCLNMIDEARERGITVNGDRLSEIFGVPVVMTAATRRWGLDRLKKEALLATRSAYRIEYSAAIEAGIREIEPIVADVEASSSRAIALAVLSGDETILPYLEKNLSTDDLRLLDTIRETIQKQVAEPLAYIINRDRLGAADKLLAEVYDSPKQSIGNFRQWLGGITMHKIWGVPFLAAVLWVAWWFVGNFGAGTLVDLLENSIFNTYLNPWLIRGFDAVMRFPHTHAIEEGLITATYALGAELSASQIAMRFVHDLFVGPYGVVTMALTYAIAIVLPVVGTFFIFFGILEDSGYLPRLAVMLNRLFKTMGLNGKAVLPMVLGLGCDTMATLTTRILETKKERVIVTLLLALGVPCSAQLGVIMAMLGALSFSATLIWLGVVGGTILFVGYLAGKLVKGESADFLLELPPIRWPKISNILVKVMARVEWYLKEAVPLFVVGTLILYLFDMTGLLVLFQKAIAPLVVGMLHLPTEAANAFLIGFLRRDYGAAGLFMMQRDGLLNPIQTVVSLSVITLFIPCIANFFMMIKERGMKTAMYMTAFIIPYAFGIGWLLHLVLTALKVDLSG
jgi:ferrous iron transport protein B